MTASSFPAVAVRDDAGRLSAWRYEGAADAVGGVVEFPVVSAEEASRAAGEAAQAERIERRRDDCFGGRFVSYTAATFGRLASDIPKAARDAAEGYAAGFDRVHANGAGLVLFGGYGTGKTYLAACVCNAVIKAGWAARMRTVGDLIDAANATRGGLSRVLEDLTAKKPLVVIDDLGGERSSDYMGEQVFAIMDWLVSTRTPRIVTCNLTRQQLERPDARSARVIDRVKWFAQIVHVNGRNYRQGGLHV